MSSVTETGPDGYDYQYLGSLYVILHFLIEEQLGEAYIEKLEKEDLTLVVLQPNGFKNTIEVQFKNRSASFNQDVFLSCITKFSARKNDENILSRIITDPSIIFIVLTSGITDGFSAKLNIIAQSYNFKKTNDKREKKSLAPIIDSLDKGFKTTKTSTQKKRKKFLITQKNRLDEDSFSAVLDKIFLIDRLPKTEIYIKVELQLSKLQIPLNAQRTVIFELLEIIKTYRGKNSDISSLIKNVLSAHSRNLPILDETYLQRDNERQLLTLLENEKVLFLTGLPLCGKTQLAIRLCKMFMSGDTFIEYFATTDMREAERFLYDNILGARICYLEDPIGDNTGGTMTNQYNQLESLVKHLPKGKERYLIITLSIDEAIKIKANGYLNKIVWNDVSIKDASFLLRLWANLQLNIIVPSKINGIVKSIIENNNSQEIIQPGQLTYLARNFQGLVKINREQLLQFINFRSNDITNSILKANKESINAMVVMGITSSTQHGISSQDIFYFNDSRKDYLPSINKERIRSLGSSLSMTSKLNTYKLKNYEGLLFNAIELQDSISTLIDTGFILYQFGQYKFTHPIYREAARNLINPAHPSRFAMALEYLKKGITCLNPRAAIQSARNLTLFSGLLNDNSQLNEIFNIAEIALSSSFVSVRDECLLFLINNFLKLSEKLQNQIKDTVRHRTEFKTDSYVWQDSVVFIPDVTHLEKEWGTYKMYSDKKKALKEWDAYIDGNVILNAQQAWYLLKSLNIATEGQKKRVMYAINPLKSFFRFDESFIREEAAFLMSASATDKDIPLIKEIFEQEDTFVNYQIIRGLFRSWPYFNSQDTKADVLLFMTQAYDNLFIVLNSIDFFSQFSAGHTQFTFDWRDDIEDITIPDMWYLWGELMPDFFKHLPVSVHINISRFSMTFRESKISNEAWIKILSSYLGWVKKHLQFRGYHTLMADTSIWFFFERMEVIDEVRRLLFVKEYLAIQNDIFHAIFWRGLIYYWNNLSHIEKNYLQGLLPDEADTIKYIILTTEGVSNEIQYDILGFIMLGKTAEEITKLLPEELLLCCLACLYIIPPYNDLDFKALKLWNNILKYYLDKQTHPAFDIAITVFFNDILIMGDDRNGLWSGPIERLQNVLDNSSRETRQTIFYNLLIDLSSTSGSVAEPYLNLFVEYLSEEEIIEYGSIINKNIEAISSRENLNEIPSPIGKIVIDNLSFDLMIIQTLKKGLFEKDIEAQTAFVKVVIALLRHARVRTLYAVDLFREWARKNTNMFLLEEMEIVESSMSQLLTKGEEQRDSLEQEYNNRFKTISEKLF